MAIAYVLKIQQVIFIILMVHVYVVLDTLILLNINAKCAQNIAYNVYIISKFLIIPFVFLVIPQIIEKYNQIINAHAYKIMFKRK